MDYESTNETHNLLYFMTHNKIYNRYSYVVSTWILCLIARRSYFENMTVFLRVRANVFIARLRCYHCGLNR